MSESAMQHNFCDSAHVNVDSPSRVTRTEDISPRSQAGTFFGGHAQITRSKKNGNALETQFQHSETKQLAGRRITLLAIEEHHYLLVTLPLLVRSRVVDFVVRVRYRDNFSRLIDTAHQGAIVSAVWSGIRIYWVIVRVVATFSVFTVSTV